MAVSINDPVVLYQFSKFRLHIWSLLERLIGSFFNCELRIANCELRIGITHSIYGIALLVFN